MKQPVCIDFETLGIESRPAYPPRPVGVAIKWPGKKARYYAWGHPVENNCTLFEAGHELTRAYEHPGGILMHNAKFDLDVADVHMGIKIPSWQKVHDTMFLLFLADPHAPDLHLKSSAERILGLPPEEQDAVRDWLLAHQPVPGVKISESPKGKEPYGKYIAHAPGGLVGKYAIGDVDRTAQLFAKIHGSLDKGMLAAYDRERRLLPHLLEMERRGVAVDVARLAEDVARGADTMEKVDKWLARRLKARINWDSDEQLADVLDRAGILDMEKIPRTPTGKPSMKRDALAVAVTDKKVLAVLSYRGRLATSLRTFMSPWLETAKMSGGLIYTSWNQTRSVDGGTRTGRLSSHPNFQNVPKAPRPLEGLPKSFPPLPFVRSYITPFAGHTLYDRDYSQQELRILAHFSDGAILEAYQANPRLDFHDMAQQLILEQTGKQFERGPVKTTGFGLVYGMGVGKLATQLGITVEEATTLKRAYLAAIPGIRTLNNEMRERAGNEEPLRTWGGRLYHCEPPRVVKDKATGKEEYREFSYKMLNVLIQGSAADCTKEAMVRYCERKPAGHHLVISVHDELVVSAPAGEGAMEILKEAMESVEFDLPMLSDGKTSTTNWAEMTKE